jgi:hypothetical protein
MIEVMVIRKGAMMPRAKDIVCAYINPLCISDIHPPFHDAFKLHYGFLWATTSGSKYFYGFCESEPDRESKVDTYYHEFLKIVGVS